ncbi:YihA family ribosome biogenesis GTP-binding protein [Campylobacter sp. faydin G-24]|uniref:Probable GTP-binding protein EngB n=1 Tax=Campylobacter anatolicus TaxID=2829105 RepID=A0ABS5HFH2_9BACT|nr:GTP-binding protein [Campylobacter anatolicus]MBR8462554.1 YihA family ribosome biogenesis GTP-binding protein [Campylobacter anatolicus]MBR8463013.1 YihA family ribosome biogenesis GTP-binding protein [Campylobacter anatolicus]MBR8465665.1 YihA family ribosome biogenesis GTP-binding protein [Campylobacter anatolicus]
MIRAIGAKFISSAPNINIAPDFATSEVVFLGRSNVGKSSLINAITNHNGLAKSSSTPGKTQLINFFEVDFEEIKEIYLDTQEQNEQGEIRQRFKIMFVDLPGFGYAKVSKSKHDEWRRSLDEFLKFRINIKLFIHLIDARHFDLRIDTEVNEYLHSFIRADQKILNLYTKADKLNQSSKSAVMRFDPSGVLVSTLNKNGIDKARELIVKHTFGL